MSRVSLNLLPLTCCCGAKYRIYDDHVGDRIFERDRLFPVLSKCLREKRALNLVLVANWKLNCFVVKQNLCRLIVRGIERDRDLDSSFSSEEDHPLIRVKTRAAGKRRMTVWKIENCRCQSVSARHRVAFDNAKHAPRFCLEHKPGDRDRITSDVHQRSAAKLKLIANVRRIGVEVTEEAGDGPQ